MLHRESDALQALKAANVAFKQDPRHVTQRQVGLAAKVVPEQHVVVHHCELDESRSRPARLRIDAPVVFKVSL